MRDIFLFPISDWRLLIFANPNVYRAYKLAIPSNQQSAIANQQSVDLSQELAAHIFAAGSFATH
jgi:hypothetical protein